MKILLNKKATAALALSLSVSMTTQGATTPPVSPSQAKAIANSLQSQQNNGKFKITGNVADNNGEPIIGASVVVNGTKNGTVTDIDGNFTLVSNSETPTLNISYVGFDTQNIKVRPGQTIKVTLKENAQSLEELVVVGYGSQKKVNVICSIANVDSK